MSLKCAFSGNITSSLKYCEQEDDEADVYKGYVVEMKSDG